MLVPALSTQPKNNSGSTPIDLKKGQKVIILRGSRREVKMCGPYEIIEEVAGKVTVDLK